MQVHRITAAVLVSLSCALGAASCVQSAEPASETDATGAHAPTFETKDESSPFGDPGYDPGIGSSSPSPPSEQQPSSSVPSEPSSGGIDPGQSGQPAGWFTYNLCCLMQNSPELARNAFCRSQPDWQVRAACFRHTRDKPVEWQNWCYNTFRNE